MATILLTEEEYNHIQGLKQDLLARIQKATPRAATHYNTLVKLSSDFLSREDGKRTQSQKRQTDREELQRANEARRAASNGNVTPMQSQQPQQRPGAASTSRSERSA